MALLYRSNAQSRVLEHALFSAGVPYRVYGGLRFFERQEIKHALAYLRLLANPDDDGAFSRVVNFPTRGIGARTLEQLSDAAQAAGTSLWQAARASAIRQGGQRSARFRRLDGGDAGRHAGLAAARSHRARIAQSGLAAHYQAEKEGADRLENLNELINAATRFLQRPGSDGRTRRSRRTARQLSRPRCARSG